MKIRLRLKPVKVIQMLHSRQTVGREKGVLLLWLKTNARCCTNPNNFGLNSFSMFGSVRCVRKFPWPPMHHDRPRFSTNTSHSAAEFAAVALVNESPTAATMSISPKNDFGKFQPISTHIFVCLFFFVAEKANSTFFFTEIEYCSRTHLDVIDAHFLAQFHCVDRMCCKGMANGLVRAFAKNFHFFARPFHPTD